MAQASFAVLLSASCLSGTLVVYPTAIMLQWEAAGFASVRSFLINVISGSNVEMSKLVALRLGHTFIAAAHTETAPVQ